MAAPVSGVVTGWLARLTVAPACSPGSLLIGPSPAWAAAHLAAAATPAGPWATR